MSYDPLDPETDPFRPPTISTLVACLHCGQEYESYRIEWRLHRDDEGREHGFWCCPIPGCDGLGFGCDIFPVDPHYRDEEGNLMWMQDDEGEEEPFSGDIEEETNSEQKADQVEDEEEDGPLTW